MKELKSKQSLQEKNQVNPGVREDQEGSQGDFVLSSSCHVQDSTQKISRHEWKSCGTSVT